MNLIEERTLALAGIFQACKQVQNLARNGRSDALDTGAVMQSILVLDAINSQAIYGGVKGVNTGLRLIKDGILNSPQLADVEILRYVMSILDLQRQLYRDDQKFSQFAQAVERLSAVEEDQYTGACSDLYQKFISDMRPQIIVQGEQDYLQQYEIPPQIRGLLLAALRSAVLWQQKGGNRFKILWERTRMQNAAKELLTLGFQ